MEERNNSKQLLLSITGIAVLVVAVVGVSFAFFSYSKTGSNTNTVQAGSIFMNFTESSTISLTNQFPMKNNEATSGLSGENQSMTFSVIGYSSGANAIPYKVYAINPNDLPSGKTRFPNSQISLFFSAASSDKSQTIKTFGTTLALNSPTVVNAAVDTTAGWEIASGTIKAGTTEATKQTDTYTLKMFVNDTVRISDTDPTVTWTGATTPTSKTTYCASDRVVTSDTYTSGCKLYGDTPSVAADTDSTSAHTYLTTYSKMYYSLKLKVVGQVA